MGVWSTSGGYLDLQDPMCSSSAKISRVHAEQRQKNRTSGRQLGLHLSSQRLKGLPQKVFLCLRPLGSFHNTESREESSPVMTENNLFLSGQTKMEAEKHLICFKGNKVVSSFLYIRDLN